MGTFVENVNRLATGITDDMLNTVQELPSLLNAKVDKESGKELSSNDYTDAEQAKLAGIATNATANSSDDYLLNRVHHTGTQAADTITDSTSKVMMTTTERTKLSGIAAGATANNTNAYLLDRTNHTGTQSADTIVDASDKVMMLPNERTKLASVETNANYYVHPSKHPVSIIDGSANVNKFVKSDSAGSTGFDYVNWSDVNGKPSSFTPSAHTHGDSSITDLSYAKLTNVPSTFTPAAHTHTNADISSLDYSKLTNKPSTFTPSAHVHTLSDISDAATKADKSYVDSGLSGKEDKTNKGQAGGYVPLDSNGKINAQYLNSLEVIDVFTPADEASMLALSVANAGDIAVRQDNNNSYMLVALPASTLANWKQLNTAGVVSVNSLVGAVNLTTTNIPEGTNEYYTDSKVYTKEKSSIAAGTNVSLSYDDVNQVITISSNDVSVNFATDVVNKPTTLSGYGISDAYTKTEVDTTISGLTKSSVGLGNVDNTSDLSKPISSATQTALNLKANSATTLSGYGIADSYTKTQIDTMASGYAAQTGNATITGSWTFSTQPSGIVKASVGLGNVDNTSDVNKPISTATQTALNGKANNATTIAGYGITDAYTKTQVDTLAGNYTTSTDLAANYYNKTQVDTFNNNYAPLTGATFTGAVSATSVNGITALSSTTPVMNGTAAVGTSTTAARADHVHGSDTSKVSTSTTVNGHALSGNVTVTASDVGLGNVTNTQQLAYTQTLAHTGDVTSSATALNTGTVAMTLAASGVTAGTYGSSSSVPVITVDAKGRVTSASTATVSGGVSSFNSRTGAVSLTSSDVTTALTFTPLSSVPAATSSAYGGIKVSLSGTTLTITV